MGLRGGGFELLSDFDIAVDRPGDDVLGVVFELTPFLPVGLFPGCQVALENGIEDDLHVHF